MSLELSLARFNMYNIHIMYKRVACKRVPFAGHRSAVLEIRDVEQQD